MNISTVVIRGKYWRLAENDWTKKICQWSSRMVAVFWRETTGAEASRRGPQTSIGYLGSRVIHHAWR
jgi:hypothetical protein